MDKNNTMIPDFLQKDIEAPTLSKPDDERHYAKLREIANSMDEADAYIVCKIFANNHPDVMFNALEGQMNMLMNARKRLKEINDEIGGPV